MTFTFEKLEQQTTDLLTTAWATESSWILSQEVVAYGSPADAGEGGRLAVRQHGDALRQLRDS
ncbi:MAG: hypothetical protein ACJ76I_07040 [Gaiellaceae bacterium]